VLAINTGSSLYLVSGVNLRVLIISDIHGNYDALKMVLETARGFDYIWFLGDLVDYGPEPHLVVDLVREIKPEVALMGNHDYAVAYNTDCMCAQELHDLSVYTRLNISYKLLTKDQIDWLKTLKRYERVNTPQGKIFIVHGAPSNPLYGYIKPDQPAALLESLLYEPQEGFTIKRRLVDADYVIVGHSHIPFSLTFKNIKVFNPGSIGQPRDGDPRASYAILDLETMEFKQYRVKYDVDSVVRKLMELNINPPVVEKLRSILMEGRTP
jgi:protein phosphatase